MIKFKCTGNTGNWFSKPAKTMAGLVSSTHRFFFAPTHPPLGKKTSLVNFKHKITTWANYTDGIGTGYTVHLMTNNCVCMVKDSKTTSKLINQIRPVLMPWWNIPGGGGKKAVLFSPQKNLRSRYGCEVRRPGRVLQYGKLFISETLLYHYFIIVD